MVRTEETNMWVGRHSRSVRARVTGRGLLHLLRHAVGVQERSEPARRHASDLRSTLHLSR